MTTSRLTKSDIALSQLDVALSFYLQGREFVSAITLAGAAENLLGNLCEKNGLQSSLQRRVNSVRCVCKQLWKIEVDSKPLVTLRNKARDELKHLRSGIPVDFDLEYEAGRLLARAVENYSTVFGRETQKMREFQRKRLSAIRTTGH